MNYQFQKLSIGAFVVLGLGMGCSQSRQPVRERNVNDQRAPRYEAESTVTPVKEPEPIKHKRMKKSTPSQSNARLATDRVNDDPLYPMPQISLDEIRMHVDEKSAVVLDARAPDDFAVGHVQDAINIPASEMAQYVQRELMNLDRDQFIIIYCQSAACHSSDMLYEYLLGQGFTNMRVYRPGWQVLARAKDLL